MNNKILKTIGVLIINLLILTGCEVKEQEKNKSLVKTNKMISYTINGEKTDKLPTKEEGYIVNKIICNNGSDLMWDNDNWEVEFTTIKSNDRCVVDYTKDTNTTGYRVTVTTNKPDTLDSLSKTTTENGTVKIYSKSKIEKVTCCNGTIEDNKVIISNIISNQTCNIVVEDKTLVNILKSAYPPLPGRTNFSKIDNGTPALYIETDDQGITYYFSGDGTSMNNWVSFAGKLWRIIRINGNGSIRLLYAGDGMDATDIGSSPYNSTYSNPAYVGWKYTIGESLEDNRKNSTKSGPYNKVEAWYKALNNEIQNYIDKEAIYCNERNIGSGSYNVRTSFYYSSYTRLITNKTPSFKCINDNDKFKKFGLMTADEVSFAGGVYDTENSKAYYNLNKDGTESITGNRAWWTMTPYHWDSSVYGTTAFSVNFNKTGNLYFYWIDTSYVIRPVISLKSKVLVTSGDGSGESPFTITLPN